MRILTLMQMAETRSEIDFDTIQQEMRLGADDVEAFVIDGKCRLWLIGNERRVVLFREKALRNFGYNISFIV